MPWLLIVENGGAGRAATLKVLRTVNTLAPHLRRVGIVITAEIAKLNNAKYVAAMRSRGVTRLPSLIGPPAKRGDAPQIIVGAEAIIKACTAMQGGGGGGASGRISEDEEDSLAKFYKKEMGSANGRPESIEEDGPDDDGAKDMLKNYNKALARRKPMTPPGGGPPGSGGSGGGPPPQQQQGPRKNNIDSDEDILGIVNRIAEHGGSGGGGGGGDLPMGDDEGPNAADDAMLNAWLLKNGDGD